jgi:hypothetical protein
MQRREENVGFAPLRQHSISARQIRAAESNAFPKYQLNKPSSAHIFASPFLSFRAGMDTIPTLGPPFLFAVMQSATNSVADHRASMFDSLCVPKVGSGPRKRSG